MAILDGAGLLGSLKNLSFYKDKKGRIIARTKGGASKKRIKRDPKFARTRENNMEFGGCSQVVKEVRQTLHPLKGVADYNFSPALQSLVKKMQLREAVSGRGERGVPLSQYGYLLNGFHLNENNTLDSLVRHPLTCSIDKDAHTAQFNIPELLPRTNLFLPWKAPFYRLVVTLGAVEDTVFNGTDFTRKKDRTVNTSFTTAWHPAAEPLPAQVLDLQLRQPDQEAYALIAALGLEMGTVAAGGEVKPIRYQGAGKILLVV